MDPVLENKCKRFCRGVVGRLLLAAYFCISEPPNFYKPQYPWDHGAPRTRYLMHMKHDYVRY